MKHTLPLLASLAAVALAEPVPSDVLRFRDGDQLSGSFSGFEANEEVVFGGPSIKDPVRFPISDLERLVLRGGVPARPCREYSHVVLRNGDRIPGEVRSIDSSSVVLETAFAGSLVVPRDQLTVIRPNPPGGGGLTYLGPSRREDWWVFPRAAKQEAGKSDQAGRQKEIEEVAGNPAPVKPGEEDKQAQVEPRNAMNKERTPEGWLFDGTSWFWAGGDSTALLALPDKLPDRFFCTMDLEWTGVPQMAVGFHADLEPIGKKGGDDTDVEGVLSMGRTSSLGRIFGNAYVLLIGQYQFQLASTASGEKGHQFAMISGMRGGSNIMQHGSRCRLEIRADRVKKRIIVQANGRRIGEWNGTTGYQGSGKALCFAMLQAGSTMRVSDLRVSEWNGMPDFASSMDVEGKDVVMLTNGSDRMAGSLEGTKDGLVAFRGAYGNLSVPMAGVEEVRLALPKEGLHAERAEGEALFRIGSLGAISGGIKSSDREHFTIAHPLLGEVRVGRDMVSAIEFQPGEAFPESHSTENMGDE